MQCPDCKRDFPRDLLSEMAICLEDGKLRYELKCPPCALKTRNQMHGLPADEPFDGPIAAAMHRRALKHLKATGQEVPSV